MRVRMLEYKKNKNKLIEIKLRRKKKVSYLL